MKKIIIILLTAACICTACFRIDKGDSINPVRKDNGSIKSQNNSLYKPCSTMYYNGVDYRISRSPAGRYGGEIITSTIGEGPKTFNPWTSKDATSSQIGDLIYDSLFSTDPDTGAVVPALAKEMIISPDLKTYTIKLRRGAKWSDGVEITADDVLFTWNDIILAGLGNTSLRDSLLIDGEYPKIKKTDKYTVEFKLKKPFAPFERFAGTSIAPKHVFAKAVKKGARYFDTYLGTTVNPKDIVSSGAFLLDEYIPAQRAVFKRNPNYYAMDENKNILPYIDKYVILITGDLNNELLKFKAGELDIISVSGKDLQMFKAKQKADKFTLYNLGPNTGSVFIAFNMLTSRNSGGDYYVSPVKQKWFNDINFRTAIDYAIDRNAMTANIFNGAAQPLFTAESLSSIFLNEKLAPGHQRDIEYAKTLLKQSGFYFDKAGILHDKNGHAVEFDLYTNAGQTEREAAGVMIKEDLRDIGIKVNFKPVEFNSLVGRMMTTSDWDMVLIGLTGNPLEPHSGKNVWYSKGHLHLFNMRHKGDKEENILPWEKELDEIIEKGALELNYNRRKIFYDKYQQIVYDERPLIYLYSGLTITAVRNKIKNLHPTALGGVLHNLDELYIDE